MSSSSSLRRRLLVVAFGHGPILRQALMGALPSSFHGCACVGGKGCGNQWVGVVRKAHVISTRHRPKVGSTASKELFLGLRVVSLPWQTRQGGCRHMTTTFLTLPRQWGCGVAWREDAEKGRQAKRVQATTRTHQGFSTSKQRGSFSGSTDVPTNSGPRPIRSLPSSMIKCYPKRINLTC